MKTLVAVMVALVSLGAYAQDAGMKKDGAHGAHGAHGAMQQQAPAPGAPAVKELTAKAELKDQKGKSVGQATFRQAGNGVIITLKLKGIPKGEHAFHIHEVGKCEAPFKTAGGHYNPTAAQHGVINPKGHHAGDLPNLHVPKNGQLELEVFTHEVTLSEGKATVFDADGSALVIHAAADDYQSDPAGNAGDRIACGVITK